MSADAVPPFLPPEEGEARELAEGIFWLRLPMPWRLNHVNAYVLDDSDGWTIVDTGIDSPRVRAIWEAVLAGPLAGRPVRRVVVTHHHPDHIGLAGWFVARGAELWASRTAWLTARMLILDVNDRPDPRQIAFWRAAGMPGDLLAQRMADRPFNMADVTHPLPPGFRRITAGEPLRLGGRDWQVRFGQGHAPDHATFWTGGLVLAGDQILARISPNISVQVTEPEADPLGEWMTACLTLAATAEAVTGGEGALVLPGHDLPFHGPVARLRQMEASHRAALDRLEAGLASPRAAGDCLGLMFRREIRADEITLALGETLAHLHRLRAEGRARRLPPEADGRVRWERV